MKTSDVNGKYLIDEILEGYATDVNFLTGHCANLMHDESFWTEEAGYEKLFPAINDAIKLDFKTPTGKDSVNSPVVSLNVPLLPVTPTGTNVGKTKYNKYFYQRDNHIVTHSYNMLINSTFYRLKLEQTIRTKLNLLMERFDELPKKHRDNLPEGFVGIKVSEYDNKPHRRIMSEFPSYNFERLKNMVETSNNQFRTNMQAHFYINQNPNEMSSNEYMNKFEALKEAEKHETYFLQKFKELFEDNTPEKRKEVQKELGLNDKNMELLIESYPAYNTELNGIIKYITKDIMKIVLQENYLTINNQKIKKLCYRIQKIEKDKVQTEQENKGESWLLMDLQEKDNLIAETKEEIVNTLKHTASIIGEEATTNFLSAMESFHEDIIKDTLQNTDNEKMKIYLTAMENKKEKKTIKKETIKQ